MFPSSSGPSYVASTSTPKSRDHNRNPRSKEQAVNSPVSRYTTPVPITPIPKFSDMDTPEIHRQAQQYGIKKTLGKAKLRTKLKEVYLYTHQVLSPTDVTTVAKPPEYEPVVAKKLPNSHTEDAILLEERDNGKFGAIGKILMNSAKEMPKKSNNERSNDIIILGTTKLNPKSTELKNRTRKCSKAQPDKLHDNLNVDPNSSFKSTIAEENVCHEDSYIFDPGFGDMSDFSDGNLSGVVRMGIINGELDISCEIVPTPKKTPREKVSCEEKSQFKFLSESSNSRSQQGTGQTIEVISLLDSSDEASILEPDKDKVSEDGSPVQDFAKDSSVTPISKAEEHYGRRLTLPNSDNLLGRRSMGSFMEKTYESIDMFDALNRESLSPKDDHSEHRSSGNTFGKIECAEIHGQSQHATLSTLPTKSFDSSQNHAPIAADICAKAQSKPSPSRLNNLSPGSGTFDPLFLDSDGIGKIPDVRHNTVECPVISLLDDSDSNEEPLPDGKGGSNSDANTDRKNNSNEENASQDDEESSRESQEEAGSDHEELHRTLFTSYHQDLLSSSSEEEDEEECKSLMQRLLSKNSGNSKNLDSSKPQTKSGVSDPGFYLRDEKNLDSGSNNSTFDDSMKDFKVAKIYAKKTTNFVENSKISDSPARKQRKVDFLSSKPEISNTQNSQENSKRKKTAKPKKPKLDKRELELEMSKAIRSNTSIYLSVLQYKPVYLSRFKQLMDDSNIRVKASDLLDFLDSKGITFSTADENKNKGPRVRKKKTKK